jgi:hypothetical protein
MILVGDGAYLIGSLDPVLEWDTTHIPAGQYRSPYTLSGDAWWRIIGPALTVDSYGFGTDDIGDGLTITIPNTAYGFETKDFELWEFLGPAKHMYVRTAANTWFDLTLPAPYRPGDLGGLIGLPDLYYPYRLKVKHTNAYSMPSTRFNYYWQSAFAGVSWPDARLSVRMPDDTWYEACRMTSNPLTEGNSSDHDAFEFYFRQCGAIDPLGEEPPNMSTQGWHVESFLHSADDPADLSLWSVVAEAPLIDFDMGVSFQTRYESSYALGPLTPGRLRTREFLSIDLDLMRWYDRVFNPYHSYTSNLLFQGNISAINFIGSGPEGIADYGYPAQMYLSAASIPVTNQVAYSSPHVPLYNVYPRMLHTTTGTVGDTLHTFHSTDADVSYLYPLDLDGLAGLRHLDFMLSGPIPADPPEGVLSVYGNLGVKLVFEARA